MSNGWKLQEMHEPPKHQWVLIGWQSGVYEAKYLGKGQWHCPSIGGIAGRFEPECWMPMPALPTREEIVRMYDQLREAQAFAIHDE